MLCHVFIVVIVTCKWLNIKGSPNSDYQKNRARELLSWIEILWLQQLSSTESEIFQRMRVKSENDGNFVSFGYVSVSVMDHMQSVIGDLITVQCSCAVIPWTIFEWKRYISAFFFSSYAVIVIVIIILYEKPFKKQRNIIKIGRWFNIVGHWHHEIRPQTSCSFAPARLPTELFSKNGIFLCIYCHRKVLNTNNSNSKWLQQQQQQLPFKTIHITSCKCAQHFYEY